MKSEKEFLLAVIQDQIRRYPKMKPVDLYKLVFQITCGGEHLLQNRKEAKKMLDEEWASLDKVQKGESLLEPIDPLGEVIRVNLRVYRKIGGTPAKLFDTFLRSAKEFKRDEQRLGTYWELLMEMAENGRIPFKKQDLEDLYIEMGRKKFPSAHHSKPYIEHHKPAYRIILKQFWEGFNDEKQE